MSKNELKHNGNDGTVFLLTNYMLVSFMNCFALEFGCNVRSSEIAVSIDNEKNV